MPSKRCVSRGVRFVRPWYEQWNSIEPLVLLDFDTLVVYLGCVLSFFNDAARTMADVTIHVRVDATAYIVASRHCSTSA